MRMQCGKFGLHGAVERALVWPEAMPKRMSAFRLGVNFPLCKFFSSPSNQCYWANGWMEWENWNSDFRVRRLRFICVRFYRKKLFDLPRPCIVAIWAATPGAPTVEHSGSRMGWQTAFCKFNTMLELIFQYNNNNPLQVRWKSKSKNVLAYNVGATAW